MVFCSFFVIRTITNSCFEIVGWTVANSFVQSLFDIIEAGRPKDRFIVSGVQELPAVRRSGRADETVTHFRGTGRAAADREVAISQWLNNSGIPAGVPQPIVLGDRPVTRWHTSFPAPAGDSRRAGVGTSGTACTDPADRTRELLEYNLFHGPTAPARFRLYRYCVVLYWNAFHRADPRAPPGRRRLSTLRRRPGRGPAW
jgi:hypothetical protein